MIGAWVFTASCGILLARYFKQTFTSVRCCKKDQWFVWHRMFMLLTWALTLAGFVLIFLVRHETLALNCTQSRGYQLFFFGPLIEFFLA